VVKLRLGIDKERSDHSKTTHNAVKAELLKTGKPALEGD